MPEFKSEHFDLLNNGLAKLIESAGDFLFVLGSLEKDNPQYTEIIESIRKNPAQINSLLAELPPKKATVFLGIIMKLGLVFNQYKNEKLTAEDKIDLGKQLKEIAKELRGLK